MAAGLAARNPVPHSLVPRRLALRSLVLGGRLEHRARSALLKVA